MKKLFSLVVLLTAATGIALADGPYATGAGNGNGVQVDIHNIPAGKGNLRVGGSLPGQGPGGEFHGNVNIPVGKNTTMGGGTSVNSSGKPTGASISIGVTNK
jgi:hypothetical protein